MNKICSFFKCLLIVHENCIASVVEEVQQVSLQTHTLLLWMELDFYTNCFILTTVRPNLNIVMSIWQASTCIIVECSASLQVLYCMLLDLDVAIEVILLHYLVLMSDISCNWCQKSRVLVIIITCPGTAWTSGPCTCILLLYYCLTTTAPWPWYTWVSRWNYPRKSTPSQDPWTVSTCLSSVYLHLW